MESFEEVYRKYFDDVYRFLRGLTGNESLAEELTQETFFRAMKSIKDYAENQSFVYGCVQSPEIFTIPIAENKTACPPMKSPKMLLMTATSRI